MFGIDTLKSIQPQGEDHQKLTLVFTKLDQQMFCWPITWEEAQELCSLAKSAERGISRIFTDLEPVGLFSLWMFGWQGMHLIVQGFTQTDNFIATGIVIPTDWAEFINQLEHYFKDI